MSEIEFNAAFNRYTPAATHHLGLISAALARIEAAPIRPAAEDELRASARAETVHYSTLIEGNELPIIEAQRAARGELEPDARAKLELVNYVEALELIDKRAEAGALEITPEFLLELHKTTTQGLGIEGDEHFAPRHEGAWRDGIAVVRDRITGTVFHTAPPPEEVEERMRGLCSWIADKEQRPETYSPAVIAGVAHYGITDIHPFADGNGRVARLTAAALLLRHRLLPGRLFSFERYYAEDREAYYDALRSVRRNTLNMNEWLEYFLAGLADEYERVALKIAELQVLGLRADTPFQLSAIQERAITKLNLAGIEEFRRAEYERIAEVGKTRANRDLKQLREAGLIVRRGAGSAARYRFSSKPFEERPGRPRSWTDERIEAELRKFCAGRTYWPTIKEFRAAGQARLYDAVARHGGADVWAAKLGLRR
jgi:Fic family protein